MWYFRSESFKPNRDEEKKTNPGIYGVSLCKWLYEKLSRNGIECSEPEPEDWGWFFVLYAGKCRMVIGCANESGSADRWRIFCERDGLFSRLSPRCKQEVEKLSRRIGSWLKAEKGVSDLVWEEE